MVKTNIVSSKSIRGRAQSDAGPPSYNETRRDKFQKPFPVKSGSDRDIPKIFPPTPPSESESYSVRRSRSQSQPAGGRSTPRSSAGSSDYTPPTRTRLDTVRDEDDLSGSEMRRAKSMSGRARDGGDRAMNRSFSTRREPRPRKDEDEIYDLYNDYYEEKPIGRSMSTRRPLARTLTRSRTVSSSRGRIRDEEDDYSRYSDDEDDEFEMITPKRSEISKVSPYFHLTKILDQSQSKNGRNHENRHDPDRCRDRRIYREGRCKIQCLSKTVKMYFPR
jgi:hypothetical protein